MSLSFVFWFFGLMFSHLIHIARDSVQVTVSDKKVIETKNQTRMEPEKE